MYLEKNNENILVNLTSDQCYIIEINKKSLNLQLGSRILSNFQDELKSKQTQLKKESPTPKTFQPLHTLPKKKPISTNPIFSTNRLSNESEFSSLLQNERNKFMNTKLSLRDFFYSTPKCDLCDQTGIVSEELKRFSNKLLLIDSLVFDYILFQCSICKVNLHKNCGYEISSFPSLNIKDSMMMNLTWVCDICKRNGLSEKKVDHCQICYKGMNNLKKPHLYKQIDNDIWVHNWCSIWFSIGSGIEDSTEALSKKVKQFYLTNLNNNSCYKCSDSNTKYVL